MVYCWDSVRYESAFKNNMKSLDSIAGSLGKYSINYVLATEMNDRASRDFLKRDDQHYSNALILGDMDNFISGLYYNPGIKLPKRKVYTYDAVTKKTKIDTISEGNFALMKRKPFYILMNSKGTILYYNKLSYLSILKDTAFINVLKKYSNTKAVKLIN